jgi:hypothetical protein
MPGKFELLPAGLGVGRGLAANFEEDRFGVRHDFKIILRDG